MPSDSLRVALLAAVWIVAIALTACAPASHDLTATKAPDAPYSAPESPAPQTHGVNFSCNNGFKFTIQFLTDGETANMVFSDHHFIHTLNNQHLGSGVAYGSSDFIYEEHAGVVKLAHPAQGKMKVTSCHKI